MKTAFRWASILSAAAGCLLIFQNCAGGGALSLDGSSKLGPFGHGANPPANAFADITQTSGVCPAGTQALAGSGYLTGVCVEYYSSASNMLVVDVQLMPTTVPCASNYVEVADFTSGGQLLCARVMPVKNAVQVVTDLYETSASGGCTAGDVLAGAEDASTILCEKFE